MINRYDDLPAQVANRRRRRRTRVALYAALATLGIFLVGMRTTQVALTLVASYYVYWLTRNE